MLLDWKVCVAQLTSIVDLHPSLFSFNMFCVTSFASTVVCIYSCVQGRGAQIADMIADLSTLAQLSLQLPHELPLLSMQAV